MGRLGFIRGSRPFSFAFAYALSIAVILGFAVWIVVDSSFPVLLDVVLIDLRLRPHPGIAMGPAHRWGELGFRLAVFGVMAVAGLGGLLVVLGRLVAGKASDRTIRRMMPHGPRRGMARTYGLVPVAGLVRLQVPHQARTAELEGGCSATSRRMAY